jgi:hypothetical protein
MHIIFPPLGPLGSRSVAGMTELGVLQLPKV